MNTSTNGTSEHTHDDGEAYITASQAIKRLGCAMGSFYRANSNRLISYRLNADGYREYRVADVDALGSIFADARTARQLRKDAASAIAKARAFVSAKRGRGSRARVKNLQAQLSRLERMQQYADAMRRATEKTEKTEKTKAKAKAKRTVPVTSLRLLVHAVAFEVSDTQDLLSITEQTGSAEPRVLTAEEISRIAILARARGGDGGVYRQITEASERGATVELVEVG